MHMEVVVSGFTGMLSQVQRLCEDRGWPWLRLDGKTAVDMRQGNHMRRMGHVWRAPFGLSGSVV